MNARLTGLAVALSTCGAGFGATIQVPADHATIQAAINAAAGGDTVLVADGLYTGAGNRDLDFGGKAIAVTSQNGADVTIIDCEELGRGARFHSGEGADSTLSGFTIRKGSTDFSGGGILCELGSSPTLSHLKLIDNFADECGGGIHCSASSPTLESCVISGNIGESRGGGVCCEAGSSPALIDCTISDNDAQSGPGGGVRCLDSSPTLVGCTISGNDTCGNGGGVDCVNSSPALTDCTLTGNHTDDGGGGLGCDSGSSPTLLRCTLDDNFADCCGGGVSTGSNCSPVLTACTLEGNIANHEAGGLHARSGSTPVLDCCRLLGNSGQGGGALCEADSAPVLTNCVIAGNTSPGSAGDGNGGGVYCRANSAPVLMNCTIAGNQAENDGGGVFCVPGAAPTLTNLIVFGNGPDELSGCPACGFCITLVDPLFVNAAAGDYHLQAGSPAIDAGTAAGAPAADIEGLPRPCGGGIDAGAFEACEVGLCDAAAAEAGQLWPPNHKFALVEIGGLTGAGGKPLVVAVTGVTQDEPVKGPGQGSGMTCPDAVLVDTDGDGEADAAAVRRERSGKGNGRVYAIQFTARNEKGIECEGSIAVCVPHDQGNGGACVDDGQLHDSTACPAGGEDALPGSGRRILTPEELDDLAPQPLFLRGDVNFDEEGDLSDAVSILSALYFDPRGFPCRDAADANDDGEIDLSDAVALLQYLFTGGFSMREPVYRIGADPTPDPLDCE